jgi:xyloglucan-specific exo-beta-1,4-glucanase
VVLTVAVNIGTVTIGDVYNGNTELTKDTNYTVANGKVTLKTAYLETLTEDDYTITIETNKGNVTTVITVEDTTTLTADPAAATFDKNTSNAEGYVDVEIEVKHNTTDVTLTSVKNGDAALTAGTDYTAVGLVVTLLKTYLDDLEVGDTVITFNTNKGDVDAVITVVDTTDEV